MAVTNIKLNNGYKVPVLGLGTWQSADDPGVVEQAVRDAVDAGYRHFDCAYIYGNEKEVGKALRDKIAEGVVKREDLFITTKLWNTTHRKEQVVPACKKSLKNFGFDYIDLYLIHWPMSYDMKKEDGFWPKSNLLYENVDYCDTWQGMEECVKLGLTKSIGLSNFNSQQIDRILSIAQIKPVMNQVECHPNLNQKKLRDFCKQRDIVITAYSPLGSPKRTWAKPTDPQVTIETPEILEISKKYEKTPAQVVLRYLIDIDTIPIPKSSSKERIKQNIDIFDFKLLPQEIATIDKLNCGLRICPAKECANHKDYPFNIEFLMMAQIPTLTFSNGYKMPTFGLGTYQSRPGEVENAVKEAINLGYRHIDTAYFYQNEKEIGEAIQAKIKDGTVKREDLFITTKLWNNFHKQESVVPICKKSLENLGLSYVDLYLVHWPFAFKEGDDLLPRDENGTLLLSDTDYLETWKGMEECVQLGLTRSIGISNFNQEQITRLLSAAKILPVNNQVEVSININQTPLIEFCKKHNITITGYSPLGQPGNKTGLPTSLDHPKIIELSKKYNKTSAQIALRYILQQGIAIIPKSVTPSRLKENINIFDFSLTSEEMASIATIATGQRVARFADAKQHKYYPFEK
ncbi:aldo-keto reductase family 1 member A1-B [Apis florea]|uniref:aldo-keto reductase family 1 member A1-B n=1 Tax=Apis florea TaxID=7463 RepID=UPI0012FE89D3|nr:aldo-keto reductase family 1 member A1-B [Apis florea]